MLISQYAKLFAGYGNYMFAVSFCSSGFMPKQHYMLNNVALNDLKVIETLVKFNSKTNNEPL